MKKDFIRFTICTLGGASKEFMIDPDSIESISEWTKPECCAPNQNGSQIRTKSGNEVFLHETFDVVEGAVRK